MSPENNNHGRLFNPSATFAGYVMILAGIAVLARSLVALALIIPGALIAFTSTGTLVDITNKRVKPYTMLFGMIMSGSWIDTSRFSGFRIERVTRKYSALSRANVRLDMQTSEIRLVMVPLDKKSKIVIKCFKTFEEARLELDRLAGLLSAGMEKSVDPV